MKKMLLTLAAMIAAFPALAQGIAFDPITFSDALKKAGDENKFIFVDCYTEWCGPCKALSDRVFTQQEVGGFFNANFVNLKIDMEKGEGVELAARYGVRAYPTMLVLDADGSIQHRMVGYMEGSDLIEQGRMALDSENSMAGLRRAYDAGDRNPATVAKYLAALLKSNEADVATTIADEFFASLPDSRKTEAMLWPIYSNRTVGRWGSPWFEFLVANKAEFDRTTGRETVDRAAYEITTDLFMDILVHSREGVGMEFLPQITERIRGIDFEGRDKVVAEAEFTMALTTQDAPRTVELFEKYGRQFSNKGIMNFVGLMVTNPTNDPEKYPATVALVELIKKMTGEEAAGK